MKNFASHIPWGGKRGQSPSMENERLQILNFLQSFDRNLEFSKTASWFPSSHYSSVKINCGEGALLVRYISLKIFCSGTSVKTGYFEPFKK